MQDNTRKMPFRKHWPVILLAGMLCLMTTTTYGGNKKMEQQPLYDFKDSMITEPKVYKINRGTSLSLFPVPFDNAVGTNSMGNALTVLTFPEGKLREDRYFKNVVDDIRGSGVYLPLISKNEVGFALGRLFLLFNFKTETARLYRLAFSIGKTPEKMAIADADKKRFLVEIEAMNNRSEDPWDYKNYLQFVELVGDKDVKLVKEIRRPTGTLWSIVNKKIFLWEYTDKKLQVLDMNFEPSQHPLGDLIKQNKFDFGLIYSHPTMPFAVFSGCSENELTIAWGKDRDQRPYGLVDSGKQFSFSPDGKWLVFRQGGAVATNKTYLMPVSEKYPHFLGTPILLIDDYFDENKFAWTNSPVSFVGSDHRNLYRWELTKEAYKSMMGDNYDKYETFHDYIVAKDLEKLTKEKKQGLGK